MKFVSWNVNGFRAILGKNFREVFEEMDADFFCLQEIKMLEGQADFSPEGYHAIYNSAERKGYSGTAIFTKHEPENIVFGINNKHTDEGRVILLEYEDFYLINCYVPNAQPGLKRINYRMEFEDDMRDYLSKLKKDKPTIYCGDLNVAHEEIDLKNAKSNIGNPGFSYEERGKMTELLDSGFIDSFRYQYPDSIKYSWWSYRGNARKNNTGWRIDYFLLSPDLSGTGYDAYIYDDILGSDHCPVGLEISL